MRQPLSILIAITGVLLVFACSQPEETVPAEGDWIRGTEEEKLRMIEAQFRGFDNAMVETAYRYQELYWAGQDQNWEYAHYQLTKIQTVIERALIRRPKRGPSSQEFLATLPDMKKAIEAKDTAVFNKGFEVLTANCNSCHAKEMMPFFTVKQPLYRQSPIRK